MSNHDLGNPRDQLADDLATDPSFLAYALACYQQAHHLDEYALAHEVGVAPFQLAALRSCVRPVPDPYGIRLMRIAEAFGADAHALARILTEADEQGKG